MNFIVKITILWRKKKLPEIPAQIYFANKGYLQTSANVFLQCAAKLLYFSLPFMFQQRQTKEKSIKELFELWNPTFIKSWGRLTFRHSYTTTECSINSRSHKINFKQHRPLSSRNLSLYEEKIEIETSLWNAFNSYLCN